MAVGINLPDLPPLNLQQVNTGLQPDDGLGDTWYQAFAKHNANMEKLALFAGQVVNRLNSSDTSLVTLQNSLTVIINRVTTIENILNNLTGTDLTDILARLTALEARTYYLPISAYLERPVVMLGLGRPQHTGFSSVKALAYGQASNPFTIKGLGLFTGANPIRALMYNHEWLVAGQDQRVNTGDTVTWYIFFSHPVKAADVVGITFTNQYTGTGQPGVVGTQTIVPLGWDGSPISQYSGSATYAVGSLVADAANFYQTATKWYRSRTASNTGNALTNTTHWQEVPKRAERFRLTAPVTSAGGERFVKLGFPSTSDIAENVDGSGRKALMPCLDRGMITVVAA